MKKKILYLSLAITMGVGLVSCNNSANSTGPKTNNEYVINEDGLKLSSKSNSNQTFYEIFVGAFSDSDGDGIGDIRGVINRLDYLNDGDPNSGKSLGVTGIWLMPVFKSSSYHKYDVTDYYTVDSTYGTNDDLKELATKCHERGITLILDLPINHTSTSNEWFLNFKNALAKEDFSNQYADYYSYCGMNEGLQGRTTKALSGTNYKYECNFDSSMPELNFDNDLVREETLNIAKYWINQGLDGFRFDAAKYIYYESSQKSIEFWKWYTSQLRSYKSDVYLIGEVWDGGGIIQNYYEAMTCFDFPFSQGEGYIANAAKNGNVNAYISQVISYYNGCSSHTSNPILAPFIANHDTDRAAGFLTVSSGDAYSAANLLLMTPGTPFIYYGEEIGMKGSRGGANTDANRRLAMLWGDDDTISDPIGATYDKSKQNNGTVSEQIQASTSLYNHYKKLIMMRNRNPEITNGTYTNLNLSVQKSVGGFIATLGDSSCIVIHNTGSSEATIDLTGYSDYKTINSYAGLGSAKLENGSLTIGQKTTVVLRKD